MDALYLADGKLFRPTEYSRGPWMADAQHGGPPAALLQRLIENCTEPDHWISRMSVELLAPVPLTPLTFTTELQQLSRRVQFAGAELLSDGRVVARARARILRQSEPIFSESPETDGPFLLPGAEVQREAPAWLIGQDHLTFHQKAVDHRWEDGDFDSPGSAVCWQRLNKQVIAGEEPSGQQRVMALADLASGVSAVLSMASGYGMINSDLDVAFVRPPVGEWLRTDATTRLGPRGTGVCSNTLCDQLGVIAHGTQTLLGRSFA
ncbi:MAG: thioesterase family protein [Acidimicrobiales bacterium]|nr:thioesterase family protein [Acidimicrobiales bacterium]